MTASNAPTFDAAKLLANMAALTNTNTSAGAAAPAAKDKATIYLAIGCLKNPDQDMSDFDPTRDLTNLPQLIGLDNMNHDTRRAGTQQFADEQADKNGFLDDLVEQALATMEPGETRVTNFIVTLYRKKDDVVAAAPVARVKRQFI